MTPRAQLATTFKPGDRVFYVPRHADGDTNHIDVQKGTVSSIRGETVFVRFLGFSAKGCYPEDLVKV